MKLLGRFTDAELIEGDEATRARAREEHRRQAQLALAMRSHLDEIPRSRLKFSRYVVEDEATGTFYGVVRGTVQDAKFTNAVAFFVDADGGPVFLELPPGPRNRDELAAQRAKREQARAERMRPRVRR